MSPPCAVSHLVTGGRPQSPPLVPNTLGVGQLLTQTKTKTIITLKVGWGTWLLRTMQNHTIPCNTTTHVLAFVHRTQFSTMHLFISHRWCRMFCMASNIFLCVFFPFNFSPILLTLVATLYLCEYFLYKKFVFLTKMNIGSATGNCTKQHPHGFRNSEYLDWHEIGCCTKIICFHTQIPKQCNWRSKMDKIRQNLCHLDKKFFEDETLWKNPNQLPDQWETNEHDAQPCVQFHRHWPQSFPSNILLCSYYKHV